VEIVIAGMICISRRLVEVGNFVRSKQWNKFEPGRWDGLSLQDKTLGIVGYGKIGRYLKPIAEAFGMKVIWYDIYPTTDSNYRQFDELLTTSDFVSVHIPMSEANRGMFNSSVFSKMKQGAIFVNVSRGALMRECDLEEALTSGHLRGAVLDVFENEPAVSPEFLMMDNVFLTPHVGGGTISSRYRSQELATENVLAVCSGKKPITPINDLFTI
jgi:phosphoglycerate dehydrogenase-like enzyme